LESEWRWNVFYYGQTHSHVKLLARVVGGFFDNWFVARVDNHDGPYMFFPVPPGGTTTEFGSVVAPVPGSNFPFGFDVDPD